MSDLISRQAAIDALEKDIRMAKSEDGELWVAKINAQMKLTMLPGIESKHGRWEKKGISIKGIEKELCSECKTWSYGRSKAFCPNCGADMRGEKDG